MCNTTCHDRGDDGLKAALKHNVKRLLEVGFIFTEVKIQGIPLLEWFLAGK